MGDLLRGCLPRSSPSRIIAAMVFMAVGLGSAAWAGGAPGLDSRGVRIEIVREAGDSTLIARWVAPTESGRTTYRWRGPDVLETLDEVTRGDSLRAFARATWRRLH